MVETTEYRLPDTVRDELVNAIGRDNALVSDEERSDYKDPFRPNDDKTYDSSLVLFPSSSTLR